MGLPDLDLIVEQHSNFKKRILAAFNKATIRRVDFKTLAQVQQLHARIDKVKKVAEFKERQKTRSRSIRDSDDVFIDGPRDFTNEEEQRMEKVLSPIQRQGGDCEFMGESFKPANRATEKGNPPNVQPVTLPVADDSDMSYNPENDSLFKKTGNLGFELIVENLNTCKSGINKAVLEGQLKVHTMETASCFK